MLTFIDLCLPLRLAALDARQIARALGLAAQGFYTRLPTLALCDICNTCAALAAAVLNLQLYS